MPLTNYAHGASGSVGVQGYATGATVPATLVTLNVKSWKVTVSKKNDDASNTGVTGFTVIQPGKATAKVTIEAELPLNSGATALDNTHNPISVTGPNLMADYCTAELTGGTTPAATAITTDTATSANGLFNFPCLVLDSFDITNANDSLISYTINATSSGPFTINGGS